MSAPAGGAPPQHSRVPSAHGSPHLSSPGSLIGPGIGLSGGPGGPGGPNGSNLPNGLVAPPVSASPHGPDAPNSGPRVPPVIPAPTSRHQLELLLLRYNALRAQGIDASSGHAEMYHLTLLLQSLGKQQRTFAARQARLADKRRGKQPSQDLDNLLRGYKLLSHGVDLPANLQGEIISVAGTDNIKPSSTISGDDTAPATFDERRDRLIDESTPVAEAVIRGRVYQRLAELERFNMNLGTVDATSDALDAPDAIPDGVDDLKTRAIVELKQLRLLTRQKSIRQHIVYHVAAQASTDPIGRSSALRVMNRRMKMQAAQELRLTEQLEKQQRAAREQQIRVAELVLLRNATSRASDMRQQLKQQAQRHAATVKSIQQFHAQVEREESRRAEKMARQRLQALRSNDEEAYIKLLDQAKDTRITHLLKQTNTFLGSLAKAVRVQQAETGEQAEIPEEELENIDYYEVAHRIKEPVLKQASILTGGQLKEYQIKGLEWMVSLVNNNLNGILADEMGLGKTIQTISLITYLIDVKRWSGPFLVIVPLSTITNWTVEFEKWAPTVKKIVFKGPPNSRKAMEFQIRSGDFQVLLTTYEYIIKNRPLLSRIRWQHMIIDEGHRMKNTQSKLSHTLTQYYYSRHRLILTGTPLQNNLPELWALLNFVLPKIFNSMKTFDDWFNTPFANVGGQDKMELTEEETLLIIRRLHKVLRPFLLRRLKKDVEKDLPDKVEKVVKCKMSALQQTLYEHMVKHNALFVGAPGSADGAKSTGIKGLNNKIMQLRKICNHPYVFDEVEDMIDPTHTNYDLLWRTAGKFELLDRILPKFKATGHRVLIFFQMTQIMTIMEDYLQSRAFKYLRLDGSTKADERSDMLKLFNQPDSPYFCFLLSTRAGGLGLNLQTADTVIIFDTDWNPFQDLQAQDRAHRIGQTKEVRILRLITDNSIEEAILQRAMSKLDIDSKVIQAGKFDNKSTNEEQEAFLRNVLEQEEIRRSDNKDDEEEMDDEELNDILARGEEEEKIFAQMDAERIAAGNGTQKDLPRLFSYDELPPLYKEDISKRLEKPTVTDAPRRARNQVVFDDGLTDEQWLKMQEESDSDSGKRRPRRSKRSQSPFDASTPKRQRLDGVSDGEGEGEDEDLAQREKDLIDEILESAATEDDPPRSRAGIFLKLPSKRQYPDYYRVIKKPISIAEIKKSVANGAYTNFEAFCNDLTLMFTNAKTYNQEGSQVYEDATVLQAMVDRARLKDEGQEAVSS